MSESNIIGYVNPLISSPSDKPAVKVSCSRGTYTSQVYRLGTGYSHPDGPPVSHRRIEAIPKKTHEGKPQYSRTGSFASIPSWNSIHLENLQIFFWCQATLPEGAGHDQFLFSSLDTKKSTGFECFLDEGGQLNLRTGALGGVQDSAFSIKLVRYRWYFLRFILAPDAGAVRLEVKAKGRDISEHDEMSFEEQPLKYRMRIASDMPLVIGGDSHGCQCATRPLKSSTFNGKIESFMLGSMADGEITILLDLDFSLDISMDSIRDTSGNEYHGKLINAPSRAVTGHNWDASQSDWTHASYGYGAIYFHDDDLDDAMWDTDFLLDLPNDLSSGCYAVLVDDGESTDFIPFFVRPDPNAKHNPTVAIIIPTFTYAAYANEHLHDESRTVHFPGDPEKRDKYFQTLMQRPDLGISLYDSHNDGSGTISSTLKRPVLNMRPDYSMWLFDGPREFSADLWFIDFLDRELGPQGYDVLADHDISELGTTLLKKYQTLLSCSHPEYPTYDMLNSYSDFLAEGGHFMYLGGNGYYWVTTHDPVRSHRIEVRRAEAGCRTFGLPPGNWHHSLTGELGGLWRSRGRPPNKLFGIGSCAMGVGKGVGYGINEEARSNKSLSFIFRGLQSETIIGDFGLVQGAASGDEIDRLDHALGTPHNAIILASTKLAGGHSDDYMLFNEETVYPMVNLLGTTSEKIRSDIVYFETSSGGAVFSVGSINWVGAMAWKAYNNNIARMTANVLHEFIRRSHP